MEKPNYYAIIPATVRYDKELKPMERLLYGEITALCGASGFCWGSNSYFADLYGVSTRTICEWVNHLKNKGYINIEIIYREGTKEVQERRLYLAAIEHPHEENFHTPRRKLPDPPRRNLRDPHEENFQENNTRVNNTSMNNNIAREKTSFKKPTVEEIAAYIQERKSPIDAEAFYAYYESIGWKVGNKPMKSWKMAIVTWEKRRQAERKENSKTDRTYGSNKEEGFDFFDF